jgi:hypothetical protein
MVHKIKYGKRRHTYKNSPKRWSTLVVIQWMMVLINEYLTSTGTKLLWYLQNWPYITRHNDIREAQFLCKGNVLKQQRVLLSDLR